MSQDPTEMGLTTRPRASARWVPQVWSQPTMPWASGASAGHGGTDAEAMWAGPSAAMRRQAIGATRALPAGLARTSADVHTQMSGLYAVHPCWRVLRRPGGLLGNRPAGP